MSLAPATALCKAIVDSANRLWKQPGPALPFLEEERGVPVVDDEVRDLAAPLNEEFPLDWNADLVAEEITDLENARDAISLVKMHT